MTNESDNEEPDDVEFDRFKNLTQDLLKVPKKELDEKRRAEIEQENPA